jgi:hypothetical protein
MSINYSEHFRATWSQQKIMSPDCIFYHLEHHTASVGIEGMAFGKVDSFSIVTGSSAGQVLLFIVQIVADKIRDLLTFYVYYF